MGFFSWNTKNTERSISNVYSDREVFDVIMVDDKKNVYRESAYEGYGIFGGKDYYELLAEMNGFQGRSTGIELEFNPTALKMETSQIRWPQLFEVDRPIPALLEDITPDQFFDKPSSCNFQGHFYELDEEE